MLKISKYAATKKCIYDKNYEKRPNRNVVKNFKNVFILKIQIITFREQNNIMIINTENIKIINKKKIYVLI